MILSDRDIKKALNNKKIVFKPSISPKQIGPSSIDLKLGPIFKVYEITRETVLDTKKKEKFSKMVHSYKIDKKEGFVLHPNHFVLASTKEWVRVPDDMVLRIEGKSTLARMGVLTHSAGFVDPGFEGTLTLEISNQADIPVILYPDMYICQVSLEYLSSPAEVPYNKRKKSLYHRSIGPKTPDTKNLF